MKIAVIVPKLANQGPILVARDIISKILEKVELIHVYYFDSVREEIDFPCKCTKISFRQSINFDAYDIVHSHMLRPDAYVSINRAKITKAICVSTIHQDIRQNLTYSYNSVLGYIFEKIWLRLLKKQDAIVTLTKIMQEQYSFLGKNRLLTTIYNGRDICSLSDESIDEKDRFVILNLKKKYQIIGCLALLTKRKGVHQIISALPYLKSHALVVIGDGKEKARLVALAKDQGVLERCLFLGYRPTGYRYLKYFDFYLMSSYSEGFPLGILEAALHSLPTICSDIPIFRELFSENHVAFFKLDDTGSLVSAVEKALSERRRLAINILKKVSQHYSVEKMASSYLKLYSTLLKNNFILNERDNSFHSML